MDIKKYLLDQIKTYESLMRDLEEEPKQKESDKPKIQYKQKPNSFLLDKINADIKNQKRLTNYYKSIKTGTPFVEEDDNIRLVNNNNNLDSSLENQFNFLMSKYVKDQTTLTNIQNNLTPEMLSELIHNWALYEPEIRRFKGQYVDSNLFLDKVRNMLLKNVNLKYPQTRNLNSVIDASREPEIEMQEAFIAKNRAADEPISKTEKNATDLLQQIAKIKEWIGETKSLCDEKFELGSVVINKFNEIFLSNTVDAISKIVKLFNNPQFWNNKEQIQIFYNWCKSVFDGSLYNIVLKDDPTNKSKSFREIYIDKIVIEYEKIKSPDVNTLFQDYLRDLLKIKFGKVNKSGKIPDLKNLLTKQDNNDIKLIYEQILTTLQTDHQMLQPETKNGHGLKPTEKQIHKKYFIDTHKLNNNVLEIRYNKNRHLTNVKTQVIGNGVKNIIHDITNNDNMNENDYHVLTEHEKHLIRTILNMLEKSHLLSNADEQFNNKFQILLGEYNAGNNSEILRNQLKQYIIHAMKLGMIGRQAGQQMLIEMSL